MADDLKFCKKKEPIVENLTIPTTMGQLKRYRTIANELNTRNLTKLHDLTRDRIDQLLTEVEVELAQSS